jgi:hypothetical protein
MRFKNGTDKYFFKTRKERTALSDFLNEETVMANTVLNICKSKHIEIPDDVYRGLAYFINEEWEQKGGSLYLLFETKKGVQKEMPLVTKETALDQMCYFFKMYSAVLAKEGY